MKCQTQAIKWDANKNVAKSEIKSINAAKLTLRLSVSTIFSKINIIYSNI